MNTEFSSVIHIGAGFKIMRIEAISRLDARGLLQPAADVKDPRFASFLTNFTF